MATGERAEPLAALPWTDRPGPDRARGGSPRSERDTAILRNLTRRIPAADAAANNNLGVVFYNKGLYAEAAEQFERALELDPRMTVAERNLQIVYFATDHFDATLHALQLRLEAETEPARAHVPVRRRCGLCAAGAEAAGGPAAGRHGRCPVDGQGEGSAGRSGCGHCLCRVAFW